jgi:thiol-disulfide isomerase/thioredoxin
MTAGLAAIGAVLALEALVILAVGMSGIITRKPFVYRARWALLFIALAFAPSMLMTGDMWSSSRDGLVLLLVAPLVWIVMVVALWFTLRGFTFIGISDEGFQSALRHALEALGIPFEESLSGVRLRDGEGGMLKVSLQSWTGTGTLTITPGKRQPVLNAIVREMRSYFAQNQVKANLFTNVLYVVPGVLLLGVLLVGWATIGRLVGGRSRSEWTGKAAPDFRLRTLAGERRRLSDEIGRRVVLVNFFATWCAPCRREIPDLVRLQREHGDEGLLVLGVDADEPPETVRAFADELGVRYPIGVDRGWIQGAFEVRGYPTTVLVGVDGRVVDYRGGGEVDAGLSRKIEHELSRLRGQTDSAREAQQAAWSREAKGAIPEHLREARVLEDRLGFQKSTFLEYEVGGELVTDIEVGASREWPEARALVTDREGARLVGDDGRLVREWRYPSRMRFPRIVKTGGDTADWLLVDDGVWDEVKAVSSPGRVLWSRSGSGAYYGTAAGNLDADDEAEFVVWTYDSRGLEVLDDRGSVLRSLRTPDPVRDVKILEKGSGGEASILYSILDRDLVELDPRGRVLSRNKPDAPALNYLTPVEWTALAPEPVFIQTYWETLNLLKPSGARVATLRAPSLRQQLLFVPLRATSVRFRGRPDPHLIVVARLYSYPRTVLHIFDREGALVYHELLEDQYAGLAVMTGPSGEADSFLLGGEGQVFRYALAR